MKPHPRIRKTVKWGGAVVTVALLVLWVANRWRASYLAVGNITVWSSSGAIRVVVLSPAQPPAPPAIEAPPAIKPPLPGTKGSFSAFGLTNMVPRAYARQPPPPFPAFYPAPRAFAAFVWWFHAGRYPNLWVTVPLWAPFAVSLLLSLWAWRLDVLWARRSGLCLGCHYDRTGLAAGAVCPECGQASPTS